MKCLMFEEIGKLNPSTVPDPSYPVWIRVEATGICGTDLKSVYVGHRYFQPPTVLGHEFYVFRILCFNDRILNIFNIHKVKL